MGLDIVEYVMAVEQEFEIVLDDDDLGRIRSVGEFHQLVLREIRTKHPPVNVDRARRAVCVSSRGFYHLRKALIQCGFGTRKEIAPKTVLESIIPKENRRARWGELAEAMKCELPRLVRGRALCWTLFGCSALPMLEAIAQDPAFVGQGIGSLLLTHAMRCLAPPIRLYTFQANVGARRFYERHGFVAVEMTDGDNEEHEPDVRYGWSGKGQDGR